MVNPLEVLDIVEILGTLATFDILEPLEALELLEVLGPVEVFETLEKLPLGGLPFRKWRLGCGVKDHTL